MRVLNIANNRVVEHVLDNGLRLLIARRTDAPVVGIFRAVEAGSADEPGIVGRGVAHFIEHMDFRKQEGDKTDTWGLEKTHGVELNAYTNQYMTGYHEVGHKDDWKIMLNNDHHRYQNKIVPDAWLKTEMQAVLNEEDRSNDGPGQMWRAVSLLALPNSNYGQETIGTRTDIINAKATDMTRFREVFYVPNNTTLIVVGDVNEEEVLREVRATYGALPRAADVVHTNPPDPPQQGARSLDIVRPAPCTMMCIAYPGPDALSRSSAAATVVQKIWEKRADDYVKAGQVHSTGMYAPRMRDPFMVVVHASLPGSDPARAENVANTLKKHVHALNATAQEVRWAKNQLKMEHEARFESIPSMLQALGAAAGLGDWTDAQGHANEVQQVTLHDVQQFTQAHLRPDRASVVRLLPGPMPTTPLSIPKTAQVGEWSAGDARAHGPVHSVIKPTHLSIVTPGKASIYAHVTAAFDPSQQAAAEVLSSVYGNGCHMSHHIYTRTQCDDKLAEKGASRTFESDRGYMHAVIKLPASQDLATAASIIVNGEFMNPVVAQIDVDAAKRNLCEEYNAAKEDPTNRAQRRLITALFSRSPYDESIAQKVRKLRAVSVDQVKQLQQRLKSQVTAVTTTDVPTTDTTRFQNLMAALGNHYRAERLQWTPRAKERVVDTLATPGHATNMLMIGQVTDVAHDAPEIHGLRAAVDILGGGMSARLMSKVRGEMGLGTYGIYANLHVSPDHPAFLVVHGTFDPKFSTQGLAAVEQLMDEWVAKGITADELNSWKHSIKAPHARVMSSPGSLTERWHAMRLDGHDDPERVWNDQLAAGAAVQLADVNALLRRSFDQRAFVTIRMGQWT